MKLRIWDSVISHFREFVAKINTAGTWTKKPVKKYSSSLWVTIQDLTLVPNYSTFDLDIEYKWGYNSLMNSISDSDVKSQVKELYARIMNARKYGHSVDTYSFTNYSTKALQTYSAKGNMSLASLTSIPAIKIYIGDLSIRTEWTTRVVRAVESDFPELNSRWCFYINVNITGYYTQYNAGNVLYLPYHPTGDYETYRSYISNTFQEICSLVESYHNIKYVDLPYHLNNKLYSTAEKIKIAKVIHDYLVVHNNYGSNSTPFTSNLELWPAMSNYVADPVCISYAKAFTYCCWRWGITALTIYGVTGYDQNAGTNNGNHAWNMVTYEPLTFKDSGINNSSIWNEVDITWDDPSNWTGTMCRWTYFNRTTEWLNGTADGSARLRSIYNINDNWHVINYPCTASNTNYLKYVNTTNGSNSTNYLYKW